MNIYLVETANAKAVVYATDASGARAIIVGTTTAPAVAKQTVDVTYLGTATAGIRGEKIILWSKR